jgi:hypothetical protein
MRNLYYSELLLERDYDLLLRNDVSLDDRKPSIGKSTDTI